MRNIVIAGIDDKDNSLIKKYIQFYHQDSDENSSWDRTYEIGDTKYDVTNLVSYDDFISDCTGIQNSNFELNAPIKKKLASAQVLVFVSSDSPVSRPGSVINSIKNIGFTNTRLVIFANSYNGSLNLGFEEFYQNNLTELFPNALILGFGKNNSAQLSAIIELINSECVLNFVSSPENKDVATIIEDNVFVYLLSQSNSSDFFWCNKDYVGGDILKTYDLDKYSFLTKKLSDVVKSWWNYKDIIPYVIYYKELTGNELEIVNKIISEDKSFYNNAVLVTKDGKKCIQGKVHYSFVDKYIAAKYNSSKSDIKNCLKEAHVGVDCSGLVSPILYETVEKIKKDKNYKEIVKSLDQSNQMWGIKRHDAIVIREKGSIIVRSVKNVRPGDIMRTCENYSGKFHIRLVIDVKHQDDGSVEIQTIESASKNGLQKKTYLFKYEGDSQSYNLIVDNYSNKEYFVKTTVAEITDYSYSTLYTEGDIVVNKTHFELPNDMGSILKINDPKGFDHIVDSYGKVYYFRRPKYLHSLLEKINVDSTPIEDVEPDGSTPGGKPSDFELAVIRDIAAASKIISEEYLDNIYFIKALNVLYKKRFEKSKGTSGFFADLYIHITRIYDKLEDFRVSMDQISNDIAGSEELIKQYVEYFNRVDLMTYDTSYLGSIVRPIIHEEIFGVEYNEDSLKGANEYFESYLTIVRMKELQDKFRAELDDASSIEEYGGIIKQFNPTSPLLKPNNIADEDQLEINMKNEIEGFISSFNVWTEHNNIFRNKAAIYSMKAFGFNYASIIDYEKECYDEAEKAGENIKMALGIALGIATGGIGSASTALLADILCSVAVDAIDLYGKDEKYIDWGDELKQIAFNATFAGAFSALSGFAKSAIFTKAKKYFLDKFNTLSAEKLYKDLFENLSSSNAEECFKKLGSTLDELCKELPFNPNLFADLCKKNLDGALKVLKNYQTELTVKMYNYSDELKLIREKIKNAPDLTKKEQAVNDFFDEIKILRANGKEDEVMAKFASPDFKILYNDYSKCLDNDIILKNSETAIQQLLNQADDQLKTLVSIQSDPSKLGKFLEDEIHVKIMTERASTLEKKFNAITNEFYLGNVSSMNSESAVLFGKKVDEFEAWKFKSFGSNYDDKIMLETLLDNPGLMDEMRHYTDEIEKLSLAVSSEAKAFRETSEKLYKENFADIQFQLNELEFGFRLGLPLTYAALTNNDAYPDFTSESFNDKSIEDVINKNIQKFNNNKTFDKVVPTINNGEVLMVIDALARHPFVFYSNHKFDLYAYSEDYKVVMEKLGVCDYYDQRVHSSYQGLTVLANHMSNDGKIIADHIHLFKCKKFKMMKGLDIDPVSKYTLSAFFRNELDCLERDINHFILDERDLDDLDYDILINVVDSVIEFLYQRI